MLQLLQWLKVVARPSGSSSGLSVKSSDLQMLLPVLSESRLTLGGKKIAGTQVLKNHIMIGDSEKKGP